MPFFNRQRLKTPSEAEPVSSFNAINIGFDEVAGVNDVGGESHLYLSEGNAAGNWWEGVFFRTNNEYFPTGPNIAVFHSNPQEDWFYVDVGMHDGEATVLDLSFDARKIRGNAVWTLAAFKGTGFSPAQNQDVSGLTPFFNDTVVFSQTAENKTFQIPLNSVSAGDQIFVRWQVNQAQSTGHAGIDNIIIEAN